MFVKELRDMQLNNLLYKSKEGAVHGEKGGFILEGGTQEPQLFSNITLYLSVIKKKTYMYKWPVEQKNSPQATECEIVCYRCERRLFVPM